MKRIIVTILLVAACVTAPAQSRNFRIGKWVEIQNSILKELDKSYVDSLPLDRMERAGVDAMLGDLDPYTVYVPEEENENLQMMINRSYGGIGAVIYKPEKTGNVIINEPYAGSPAMKNGLQCGDEIMMIDGHSVIGLTSSECSERMRGEPGTKVRFKVRKVRSAEVVDIDVIREKIRIPDISYCGMLDETTGYISQTGFSEGVAKEMRESVRKLIEEKSMKKLVLDLRGNGGGLLSEAGDIVSIFVPKGSLVVTAKGKCPESNYVVRTRFEPVDTKLPLVILVDSGSASASEIVSGALQDLDRATIMGERTFGKGLVQSIRSLPYGGELKLTTAKYYTPSGRCVQAIDYSNRKEDGSVGYIPDSLTHEFRTAGGRIVRDGGGISPDVEIKQEEYSRITYSVVTSGIAEQFALDFVSRHDSIPPVADFHLSDEEYDRFVEFASSREFDYRSSAKTYFDLMCREMEKDGVKEAYADVLKDLSEGLEMEKKSFLELKKSEIVQFLEEEIAVRYYYQQAGVEVRIRYDDVLKKALGTPPVN